MILSAFIALGIVVLVGVFIVRSARGDEPAIAPAAAAAETSAAAKPLLDERSACMLLIPALASSVDVVAAYANNPNSVDQPKLLHTIGDLRSFVEIAPTAMRADVEEQITTLQQIQRALIGGVGPSNLQPFKDSGIRLATRCLPYATDTRPTPTAAAAAANGPKTTILGNGTFLVGVDLVAGTYRTTVPTSSRNCYWERLRGTSGQFSDIIANENTPSGGQAVVTIATGDKAFRTSGCGTWQKID